MQPQTQPSIRQLSPIPQSEYACTRAEVAKALGGISVQAVAAIEKRALNKLRLKLLARGVNKPTVREVLEEIERSTPIEYDLCN